MHYQWVAVGAGLVGATLAERIATELDQRVLVIEARDHVAGNAFDEVDDHGILVHRYGPHIFHTNDDRVWKYLSRFTSWRPYEHHVRAEVDGQLVPVPFNLNSLEALVPSDKAARLQKLLRELYGQEEIPILRLREAPDVRIRDLAEFVYEKIFRGYTLKQWGLTPEQLGPAVMGRVPVRVSHDDRHFRDRYQGVPLLGYTHMIEKMLCHPNIEVALRTNFKDFPELARGCRVIYTGPIDAFFGYVYGTLPYRSLGFEFTHKETKSYQPVAQVNFPNEHEYTRVVEHKHITGQEASGTTITKEYPKPHTPGINHPFYPIPRPENLALYRRYAAEAAKSPNVVLFAGRLADYKYYNMDQAVARALSLFQKEIVPMASSVSKAVVLSVATKAALDSKTTEIPQIAARLLNAYKTDSLTGVTPAVGANSRNAGIGSADPTINQVSSDSLPEPDNLVGPPTHGNEHDVRPYGALSFRVVHALRIIESEHALPDLDLARVSAHVGITKSHLCRLFGREVGIGVPDYICKVRTQAAERLLTDTVLSIKEIAARVGFAYTSQLDRAFKSLYGCTPREYRRDLPNKPCDHKRNGGLQRATSV